MAIYCIILLSIQHQKEIAMKVQVSRSKNSCSYYIAKGFRDPKTKRTTTKIVEKLGTEEAIRKKIGPDADIMQWCKMRADELDKQEKAKSRKISVSYDPNTLIVPSKRISFNCGYLFLQSIYASLNLKKACIKIADKHRFSYDLNAILACLVYGRILEPTSKRATFEFSHELLEQPNFEQHHIYRALSVLQENSQAIQEVLYKSSDKQNRRKTEILYYDCTNFFFEIEKEDEFRRYGLSKQHQPLPLVQMGLLMDANGMPLAFDMQPGNTSEQSTLTPLEERVMKDFGISKFIMCTDAGLSSTANRQFNSLGKRHFITTQSLKKLRKHLKEWALNPSGWHCNLDEKEFNLDEVCALADDPDTDPVLRNKLYNTTFYKTRRIKEKNSKGEFFEQNLVSTFSLKFRSYARSIREGQLNRAISAIKNGSVKNHRKGQNDPFRFAKRTSITQEGETASKDVWEIDVEKVAEEQAFDGFYGLATSLDVDDLPGVLKVAAGRWEIEECFRIMKNEMKARPAFMSREDRLRAHFLICFIALLVYRILEKKLDNKFSCIQIIDTLKEMCVEQVRGEGWRPLYMRTEITDALHDAFGFRTDYEIVPQASMKKIIRKTKGR